ncbi:MAG: dTMP kinase [Patescibacteria group bacterium]|jgi:dTMP kinase
MYIVFEGLLGTGKTTQSKALVESLKARFPERKVIWTREPGGSDIAEAIRLLVQATPFNEEMDPICEAYLYASARAQSLRRVVKPVLNAGGIVISDRSFCTSVAWQGFGRGLGLETVLGINAKAIEGLLPDLVIQLELDPAMALARTSDARGDKFETQPLDFHERCAEGYKALARHPLLKDRWRVIDASGTTEQVQQTILETLSKILP